MTDSIRGISGAQGTSTGGGHSDKPPARERDSRRMPGRQDDLIEISRAARNQAAGNRRKSLLEYLKDLLLGRI